MPVLVKALGYYSHRGGKEAKGFSKLSSSWSMGSPILMSPGASPATGKWSRGLSSLTRSKSNLSGA